MPTPLTPDEEFDAHFRQGLEHYPEQPEDPAAWQRMDLLLDGQLRRQVLRRRVWRLLSAEAVLLVLGTWLVVHWAGVYTFSAPSHPAAGASTTTRAENQRLPLAISPATAPWRASQAPGPLAATNPLATAAGATDAASAPRALAPTPSGTVAPTPGAGSAILAANAGGAPRVATGPGQLAAGSLRPAARPAGLLAAARRRVLPPARPATTAQPGRSGRRAAPAPATLTDQPLVPTSALAASASRRSAEDRHSAEQGGVAVGTKQASSSTQPLAQARHRQRRATRRGAVEAAAYPLDAPLATTTPPGRAGLRGPAGAVDSLAARYPARCAGQIPELPDSLAGVALASGLQPADSLRQPRPVPAWQAYRLRLGVVASPELNSVRASHPTPLGGDVGLQADYQLARRWHLSVSYLQTLKRYAADGADYHLPAGYATPHNWTISDVGAVCRIIDIPVNLRYDVVRRPGYQLFASAGLSSLFMRREQYTYNYEPVNGKTFQPTDWTLLDGSNHYLKILNLSAGYERAISSRWTVQAEPYLKLPLGGVGFGQVRLMSAGLFFSFRYGLLPARPAPPAAR